MVLLSLYNDLNAIELSEYYFTETEKTHSTVCVHGMPFNKWYVFNISIATDSFYYHPELFTEKGNHRFKTLQNRDDFEGTPGGGEDIGWPL